MSRGSASERVPFSYRALQAWGKSAISIVYRHVDVTDRSRVPRDRPAVLAANHGNALADVGIIVAKMPKFPHFLAAASLWKSAPARVLFRLGGVVPIHRRRDGETEQNTSTFEACHTALKTGAHIAIFPEGEMHLEPALLPLKTGAARIALGAAAEAGVAGVAIVPVGLVYEDRGRFRSDVEIRFGEPIEVDEWIDTYRVDPTKTVRAVTDLLAERLAAATVNHGSLQEAALIDRAAALTLADEPRVVRGGSGYARRNDLRRALASSFAIAGGETSEEYRKLVAAVDAHAADLLAIGVTNASEVPKLAPASGLERVRVHAELAALTLPAILGVLVNGPMVCVVAVAAGRVRHEAWQMTTKGVGGTLLSPVLWTLEYVALSRRIGRRRALALTAAGAAGGLAALAWRERARYWQQIRWRDDVAANDPTVFARAEASRAALREQVVSLVGAGTVADLR